MTDWVETTTAIGTAGAAIGAFWAVLRAGSIARYEREHQRNVEHFESLVALLDSFEEIQKLRPQSWPAPPTEPTEACKQAQGRFAARLRASSAPLEITRGFTFRHIPYGAVDDAEAAVLEAAPREGDPEVDTDEVMFVRAEIVAAVNDARADLNSGPPRTFRARR